MRSNTYYEQTGEQTEFDYLTDLMDDVQYQDVDTVHVPRCTIPEDWQPMPQVLPEAMTI